MKKVELFVALIVPLLLLSGCASMNQYSSSETRFGSRVNRGFIEHDPIREASGIVASRNNPNVLWIHSDSGTPAVYAINTRGQHLGEYLLHGCMDTDWEDIAIGPGATPDQDYLYIGAIGDNRQRRPSRSICRIAEPQVSDQQEAVSDHIFDVDVVRYRYADGSHDAETLLLDPITGNAYVITKRVKPAGVYQIPLSFTEEAPITVERIAELPYRYLVAGDISADGMEILIKTYTRIYYWRRLAGESLEQTLKRRPRTVPYVVEPQGEAVGWSADGQGYYTVSEEPLGIPARLYFYPRLSGP
jgi:hypothetical protein